MFCYLKGWNKITKIGSDTAFWTVQITTILLEEQLPYTRDSTQGIHPHNWACQTDLVDGINKVLQREPSDSHDGKTCGNPGGLYEWKLNCTSTTKNNFTNPSSIGSFNITRRRFAVAINGAFNCKGRLPLPRRGLHPLTRPSHQWHHLQHLFHLHCDQSCKDAKRVGWGAQCPLRPERKPMIAPSRRHDTRWTLLYEPSGAFIFGVLEKAMNGGGLLWDQNLW